MSFPQWQAKLDVPSVMLRPLGNISGASGDYEAARKYHERVLDLEKMGGNVHGVAVALSNIANSMRLLGDYAKSRELRKDVGP